MLHCTDHVRSTRESNVFTGVCPQGRGGGQVVWGPGGGEGQVRSGSQEVHSLGGGSGGLWSGVGQVVHGPGGGGVRFTNCWPSPPGPWTVDPYPRPWIVYPPLGSWTVDLPPLPSQTMNYWTVPLPWGQTMNFWPQAMNCWPASPQLRLV